MLTTHKCSTYSSEYSSILTNEFDKILGVSIVAITDNTHTVFECEGKIVSAIQLR